MTTLGGTMFVMNGERYDYNYLETIQCLKELCDEVVVCVIPTDDGTIERLHGIEGIKLITIDEELWNATHGRERLSYFSNVAIANLTTEWNIYVQADECVHHDSFPFIRKAIETGKEAFMCTRINLWRDPYSMLKVEGSRNPCSPQVIRLAKTKYRCVGDAESIDAPASMEFVNDILIYHSGFVRKREVMKSKVIHMQQQVFDMADYDKRLDEHEQFEPMDYFEPHELVPIPKPLPKYLQKWAAERTY